MAELRNVTPGAPTPAPARGPEGAAPEATPRAQDLFTDSFSVRRVRNAVSQVAQTGTRWLSEPLQALGDLVEKVRAMFWFSSALELGRRAESERRKRQEEKQVAEAEDARREAAIQRLRAEQRAQDA